MGDIFNEELNRETWKDRSGFLNELQTMGDGWDGYSAKSPNSLSVTQAQEMMAYLSARNFLPPKLMVDEDGDVVLTWGKERDGVVVFLTFVLPDVFFHVMDGGQTTFFTTFDLYTNPFAQTSIADKIEKFYPDASRRDSKGIQIK